MSQCRLFYDSENIFSGFSLLFEWSGRVKLIIQTLKSNPAVVTVMHNDKKLYVNYPRI